MNLMRRVVPPREHIFEPLVGQQGIEQLPVHEPDPKASDEGFAHQKCVVGAKGRANGNFHTLTLRPNERKRSASDLLGMDDVLVIRQI